MPPLLLVALPLLWLMVRAPLAGFLIAFVVVAAVLSAALIVRWQGRPAPTQRFQDARQGELPVLDLRDRQHALLGRPWLAAGVARGADEASR
jgi:ABC-type transport system involved in cytochrome c biogenesis permease subunit